MKKTFNYAFGILALAGIGLLASCGSSEDDETPVLPDPTLTVTTSGSATISGTDITAVPGDDVTFSWSASTPGGFNVFRATQGSTILLEETRNDLGLSAGAISATGTPFTLNFDAASIGTSTLELLVVDDNNGQDAISFTITVSEPPSPEARSYSAVLLAAPLANFTGESFFSSNTGEVYSPSDVTGTATAISPNIDFGYYYGATNQASLASPTGYSQLANTVLAGQVAGWNTLNSTIFVTTSLSSEGFLGISTWANIDEIYDAGTDDGQVISNLTEGQVLGFATDADKDGGSKKGLIYVRSITAGDGELGRIEIDVLVQEDAQ